MSAPTVKVVIIGASGCGKTSLRGQYISGRYSTGYRATIGADFIAKSVPHATKPNESVTLQIWDTAGQERFSSLSSAFFRGADAAILVFDVNQPETLDALLKWWAEFRDRAPLADEDAHDYCCVVVGNKMDLTESPAGRVTEASARQMLNQLVPPLYNAADDPLLYQRPTNTTSQPPLAPVPILSPPNSAPSRARASSHSIAIHPATNPPSSPKRRLGKSRSRSSSRFYGGTMTTTHTTLTIYHTPSSSLFDVYASARTSPEPWDTSASASPARDSTFSALRSTPPRRLKSLSNASSKSSSSASAATITPSLFARNANSEVSLVSSPQTDGSSSTLPPPPIRGPALFFTSARTGAGVSDVFEYVAKRVSGRWEWEHEIEARRMSVRDPGGGPSDILRLGLESSERGRTKLRGGAKTGINRCC